MAQRPPELSTIAPERTDDQVQLDIEAEIKRQAEVDVAFDEMIARNAASDAVKQRYDDHLRDAKETGGGRGYEFSTIVDNGHTARAVGGSAINGRGIGQRPYGMPGVRTRMDYNNPYINRHALRYQSPSDVPSEGARSVAAPSTEVEARVGEEVAPSTMTSTVLGYVSMRTTVQQPEAPRFASELEPPPVNYIG